MTKKISFIHWIISALYILLNFKKIRGAFRSDVWSKEIDLINHVTNFTVHLQVISVLLFLGSLILIGAYLRKVELSKIILIPFILVAAVLFINTQIDFVKWIEINVFGSAVLLVLTLMLLINFLWKLRKQKPILA